jgi:hypothetical protein
MMEIQGYLQTKLYRSDGNQVAMQPFSQKPDYWPNLQEILSVAFLLLAALFFSGCSGRTPTEGATPEDTAVSYVRKMTMDYFAINDNSVEAIQTVELKDLVLVLVQYSGTRRGGRVEICEMVLETEKTQLNSWETKSSAGLCHEINDPIPSIPITTGGSRGNSTPQNPGFSTVYGLVRDPQITKVVVTWADEHVQSVDVQESTYMAAREGGFDMKKVEAFDDQNEIVYTTNQGTSGMNGDKK